MLLIVPIHWFTMRSLLGKSLNCHEIVEEEEMGGQHCPHVSLPTRAYHDLQLLNSWLAAGDASESSFSNSLEAAACVHDKILSKTQRKRLRKKVLEVLKFPSTPITSMEGTASSPQ